MIDIENEVFSAIASAVRTKYSDAYVVGEYVKSPSKFPCVSVVEIDNSAYDNTQTSGSLENHASVTYEVNIYSNKTSGKKSEYPRAIDFAKFREIADEVGAYLMVDMAHIAGLVAAGLHQNPVPYAHVVTSTTHKTLRGPRGGLILCKEELAKQIDKAIFPGTQGGPLMHIIAAKAVAFGEALTDEFKEYQKRVVENAKTLADALLAKGFKLVSGGTDNHLMLVDLIDAGITGKELEHRLDEVHITLNKNAIPNDPQSPFITSGVRIGTPAVTSRGFGKEEMVKIASFIYDVTFNFEESKERVKNEVIALCKKFPIYNK